MFFSKLRYISYQFLLKKPFNPKAAYHSNHLSRETLVALKSRLKQNTRDSFVSDKKLDTSHLNVGGSVLEVIEKYGKPSYIVRTKTQGIRHEVILYKRMIHGLKSKIIYNFINDTIASVTFNMAVENETQREIVNEYISSTYLDVPLSNEMNQFSVTDGKGNRLIYEYAFDLVLTFANNDAEVIQNINAALYHKKYMTDKYIDSSRFQLSID